MLAVHEGRKSHKCDICDRALASHSALKIHLLTIHNKVDSKAHQCKICGKLFAIASLLDKHVGRFHEKRRDFVCEICEKTFASKECVKAHMAVHGDTKPFQCQMCGKAFALKKRLQRHVVGVHEGKYRKSGVEDGEADRPKSDI